MRVAATMSATQLSTKRNGLHSIAMTAAINIVECQGGNTMQSAIALSARTTANNTTTPTR